MRIPDRRFVTSTFILGVGMLVAQVISFGISPVLTRLYVPEGFGTLAVFMSVVNIIGVVATGRYELAVMLPADDEEAINIVQLSIFTLMLTTLLMWGILFMGVKVIPFVRRWQLPNAVIHLMPAGIFSLGVYNTYSYMILRKKYIKQLSISHVVRSSVTAATQTVGGLCRFVIGLPIGVAIGYFVAALYLRRLINPRIGFKMKLHDIKRLAKRYRKFPTYSTASILLNTVARESPSILLAYLWGTQVAGFYYLGQRVIGMPLTLACSTIGRIFLQRAAEEQRTTGTATRSLRETLRFVGLLSVIPFPLLMIFAPRFFAVVFGTEWYTAGIFARVLVPLWWIRFIVVPITTVFEIFQRQEMTTVWNLCLCITTFGCFLLGKYFCQDTVWVLGLFAGVQTLLYIGLLVMALRVARCQT